MSADVWVLYLVYPIALLTFVFFTYKSDGDGGDR